MGIEVQPVRLRNGCLAFFPLAQVARGVEPRILPCCHVAVSVIPELAALSLRPVSRVASLVTPQTLGSRRDPGGLASRPHLAVQCPLSLACSPVPSALSLQAGCATPLFLSQPATLCFSMCEQGAGGQGGICPPRPGSPPQDQLTRCCTPYPPLRASTGALTGVMLRFQVSWGGWWRFLEGTPALEKQEAEPCRSSRSCEQACPDGRRSRGEEAELEVQSVALKAT